MSFNVSGPGNLVRDPRFFPASEGKAAMIAFTVAANRWDGKENVLDGYFDVHAYGKLAENLSGSLRKGTRVTVVGTLKQWANNDGVYKMSVRATDVGTSHMFAGGPATAIPETSVPDEGLFSEHPASTPARDEKGRFASKNS